MTRREATTHRTAGTARRRTVLLYCGATRTEPDYFNGVREVLRRPTVTVKVRQEGVDPVRLVRAAAAYRDRHPGIYLEPTGTEYGHNPSTNIWQLIETITEYA